MAGALTLSLSLGGTWGVIKAFCNPGTALLICLTVLKCCGVGH